MQYSNQAYLVFNTSGLVHVSAYSQCCACIWTEDRDCSTRKCSETETESADQPSFQFGSLITDRRAITLNKAPTCWIRPLCICSCWNKAICEPFNPRNNNFSRDRQKSVSYQRHFGFFCERWNDGSEYDWGRNITWTKTTLKLSRPNKDWCVTGIVLIVKYIHGSGFELSVPNNEIIMYAKCPYEKWSRDMSTRVK